MQFLLRTQKARLLAFVPVSLRGNHFYVFQFKRTIKGFTFQDNLFSVMSYFVSLEPDTIP